jgi:hypothetical protein
MATLFQVLVSLSILIAIYGPALAGPPLLTDDTGTPGDRHWEINLAYTLDKRHTETTHEVPILDFNYGVGDNIQLKYEVPWLVLHERDAGTKSGLGKSVVGVKWRFLDEKRYVVSMSVYPQCEFNNPTSSSDRGLVDKGTDVLLPLQVSKRIGQIWVNGEIGYMFRQHFDDEWLYALSSGYQIRENLTFLGEIHCNSTNNFDENEVVFNMGTQWDLNKTCGILASVGRSLYNSKGDDVEFMSYLGVQFLY